MPSPFGPQLPLREDVDAHMRLMAALLPSWEARVRATARLSRPDPQQRQDSPEAITRACTTLAAHAAVLFALQPGWMTRTFRYPLDDETAERFADTEIVRIGEDYVSVMTLIGAEDAGREFQFLHYRARSVLLETNPPPEILISPCRHCEMRSLRRAWPEAGGVDLYSRCASCRDEMTAGEYREWTVRNAAFYRHKLSPATLAEVTGAA